MQFFFKGALVTMKQILHITVANLMCYKQVMLLM